MEKPCLSYTLRVMLTLGGSVYMGVGADCVVLSGSGGLLTLEVVSAGGSSAFGSSAGATWGSGGPGCIDCRVDEDARHLQVVRDV